MISGELWMKIKCKCGAINFVYGGYFPDSDSSRLDADGYKCWDCRGEFPYMEIEGEEPEYFRDGQRGKIEE